MAGQARGPGLTGKEHPGAAGVVGGQAIHTAQPGDLCAPPRYPSGHSKRSRQFAPRLRVALVDGDERVHDFVRQAFVVYANGWVLDSHVTLDAALGLDSTHSRALPDVLLLEGQVPGLPGIEYARRLTARLPRARIVMLTACAGHDTIVESVMAGVHGYLIKPVAPEYLVWAVSEAAQGRPVLCGEVQTAVLGYLRRVGATTRCKALGWREREIMLLVMRGATNKDIARKLGIEAGTVHWYLNKVFKKMQVHSRDEARRRFAGGGGELMLSMGGLRTYHSPTLCVRLTSCSISAALFCELQHRDVNVWHGNARTERAGISGVPNQGGTRGDI